MTGRCGPKEARSNTSPMFGAPVKLPMVGCRVETIPAFPPYSSQVSRGRQTGKIRSANSVVSSMKLLKLTTNKESRSRASLTPLPGGKAKAGLTLFNRSRFAAPLFNSVKNSKTVDLLSAVSTRCRLEKSIRSRSGSKTRLRRLTAMLACRLLAPVALVVVPRMRGFRASCR